MANDNHPAFCWCRASGCGWHGHPGVRGKETSARRRWCTARWPISPSCPPTSLPSSSVTIRRSAEARHCECQGMWRLPPPRWRGAGLKTHYTWKDSVESPSERTRLFCTVRGLEDRPTGQRSVKRSRREVGCGGFRDRGGHRRREDSRNGQRRSPAWRSGHVRAPDHVEHRFRGKWNTDSGASGTPIPAMWNTDSGQVERTR